MKLLLIAVMGAAGTLARYGTSLLLRAPDGTFPWATLVVNGAGSFAIGLVAGLTLSQRVTPQTRDVLAIGLLGGLTTWSSFAWETFALARNGSWGLAAANALAQLVVGLALAAAGFALTRPA